MHKSTLLIMTATIAAIITTSVLAHALPKQVFAIIPPLGNQVSGNHQNGIVLSFQQPPQAFQGGASGQVQAGKVLAGTEDEEVRILCPLCTIASDIIDKLGPVRTPP